MCDPSGSSDRKLVLSLFFVLLAGACGVFWIYQETRTPAMDVHAVEFPADDQVTREARRRSGDRELVPGGEFAHESGADPIAETSREGRLIVSVTTNFNAGKTAGDWQVYLTPREGGQIGLRESTLKVLAAGPEVTELDASSIRELIKTQSGFAVTCEHVLGAWRTFHFALNRIREHPRGKDLVYEVFCDAGVMTLIYGRIVNPQGIGTDIAIRPHEEANGRPTAQGGDLARTHGDGRFSVFLDNTKSWFLVGTFAGFRPLSVMIPPHVEKLRDLGTLKLDRGAAIRGRVTRFGEPLKGARLRLHVEDLDRAQADGVSVGGGHAAWAADRVAWSDLTTSTGETGEYEIYGLETEKYLVRLESTTDGNDEVHESARLRRARPIFAPADGVDFDLSDAELKIRVADLKGQPVLEWMMSIIGPDDTPWFGQATNSESVRRLYVLNDVEYHIVVTHPHFDTWRGQLTVPVGQRTMAREIQLTPLQVVPLVIEITNDPDNTVPKLILRRKSAAADSDLPPQHSMIMNLLSQFGQGDLRSTRGADGLFAFGGLALRSGLHTMQVKPAGVSRDQNFFLDTDVEFTASAGTDVHLKVALLEGGLIDLSARDGSGTQQAVEVKLFPDGATEPVPLYFELVDASSLVLDLSGRSFQTRLSTTGTSRTAQPLLPGPYTLVAEWRDRTIRERVVVRAREITSVNIQLE